VLTDQEVGSLAAYIRQIGNGD
jgi:hypothetical protein